MWVSLHECGNKRSGFTCMSLCYSKIIWKMNMIGVFEQIIIYVFLYMIDAIFCFYMKFMWISLHECKSKILRFTCLYVTFLNVFGKYDNIIGVFESILMKK
jgi:hypothetical protein